MTSPAIIRRELFQASSVSPDQLYEENISSDPGTSEPPVVDAFDLPKKATHEKLLLIEQPITPSNVIVEPLWISGIWENTTTEIQRPDIVDETLWVVFAEAEEEIFEDGMESAFSEKLVRFIGRYGNHALDALTDFILGDRVNPEVAAEALRWVGQMEDRFTHRKRRWLLERCLRCESSRGRDGAVLGLAFMDDPHAIPYLERAIEGEAIAELRQDMGQTLEQFEDTRSG